MMKIPEFILNWLLEGDSSIRWQTLRDLMDADFKTVEAQRRKVSEEGWGARLLACQDPDGLWSGGLYTPKWTSTTYTLLALRDLGLAPDCPKVRKSCHLLLDRGFYRDGGINFFGSLKHSETCVTGMVLSILSYFQYPNERVDTLAEHLLKRQMPGGGWNCQSYKGATHGSFHTTINVLEGLLDYERLRTPLAKRVIEGQARAREFLRVHRYFRSHRTGEVVDERMMRFSFPPRWHYDILRGLDHFQNCGVKADPRDEDAVALVRKKQSKDGTWPLQNLHPGKTFFKMEQVGRPSRWNTLRALRVLRWFDHQG
jgi:hypothetical protein